MCLIVPMLMLLSQAPAQSSDWQVVKSLPLGSQISVQIGHHWLAMKCHLEEVTDDELTCAHGWPVSLEAVTYPRTRIRTVRIAHNTALIGFVVGAGAGAVIGLARDHPTPGLGGGGDAVMIGGLLGLVGAGIGGMVSPVFPGRVIYRAARQTSPAVHPEKAPTHPANATAPTPMASSSSGSSSAPVLSSALMLPLALYKTSQEPDPSMSLLFFRTDAQFACESL